MIIGNVDLDRIHQVLSALSTGVRRVESATPDGRKITGCYLTDKQIRIDIVEAKSGNKQSN